MIQKVLTWVTAVLENLFFAGIIFGWANIEPVLVKEGYFSEGCVNASIPNNVTMVTKGATDCEFQQKQLSLVFTIATSCGLLFNIAVGSALDYLGIWTVRTVLINIAVLALAITGVGSHRTLYFTFPIVHIAGLGLHVTNLQMSNIFDSKRNLYVSSISGALMSSSLTFLTFSYLYDQYSVSFETLFTIFAIIYSFLNLRTFMLTPKIRAPKNISKGFKYGYNQLMCFTKSQIEPVKDSCVEINDGDTKTEFKSFACSLHFITTVISNSVANFVYMLYISNFNMFISSLLKTDYKESEETAVFYGNIFGIVQFSGLIFSFLNGATAHFLKRNNSTNGSKGEIKCCLVGLFIGCACTIGMQICTVFSSVQLQLLSMTLQVLGKAFFISSSNTFISMTFPCKIFGRLYSVLAVCQALFLLLQHPLMLLLEDVLNRNFVVFNSCMTCVSVLTLAQPLYVVYWLKVKKTSFDRSSS